MDERIADVLLRAGVIDEEQAERVREEIRSMGADEWNGAFQRRPVHPSYLRDDGA